MAAHTKVHASKKENSKVDDRSSSDAPCLYSRLCMVSLSQVRFFMQGQEAFGEDEKYSIVRTGKTAAMVLRNEDCERSSKRFQHFSSFLLLNDMKLI